jgi:predicted Zn-dependent peptidase
MKETFQKTVLPNGLRIVTERIPQYPSASIGIWVNVGSQDEEDSNRGVSHFLEHLMFKGTPSHSAKEIAEIMDGIGGNLNAFTEKEQTCFYAKVMDKHIPTAMEIMGDMILNSHFPEPEVEREKGVILEEIKMYEDSPDELVFDLMAQTAWKNHPLGLPILGTKESILQTNRQTLRQFVERFYTPEHIIISVAGKVKHEEIVKLTQTYFQFSRRSNHSRINLPPPQFTPSQITKYKDTEQVHFCIGMKGVPQTDEKRYVFSLLDTIVGGSVSSRLFQEIREKRGLVYSISTFQGAYADSAIFGVYGAASPSNLETVTQLVLENLAAVKDKGVTAKELHTAKEHLKGGTALFLESSSNRMIRMAKDEVYHKRFIPHKEILKKIQEAGLQDIKNIAQEIFQLDALTWAVLGPIKQEIKVG